MLARERGGQVSLLLLSGILAGIGFLTRETSMLLVVLWGLLFVFRPAMPRWRYLLVALGFSLVVGGQTACFAAWTGDPFYRTHLSAKHDKVDRSANLADAERTGRALDREGVLATAPLIAPFAAVFISQKYGLLFVLALPAYAFLRLGRWMTSRQQTVIDCAALGALVAFLFVALNVEILYVVPRYFMVSAALAALPVAVLGSRLLGAGSTRRIIGVCGIFGFVTTSLGLLYLENTRPMWAEEHIAEYVAASDAVVHVDPETARRLRYLLLAHGLQDRVSLAPPGPGSLVATEDGVVQACLRNPNCAMRERMVPFTPAVDWTKVAQFEPPHRAVGGLIDLVGMRRFIPADILRKIEQPGVAAILYRRIQTISATGSDPNQSDRTSAPPVVR